MEMLIQAYVFVLGLLFGSFVNVLVLRHESGEGIGGRSHCSHCNRQLRWFENIPLLSFVVLGGRCRTCKHPISFQYPITELLTGAIFLLIWQGGFELPRTILLLAASVFLVAIAVYDFRTTYVPDEFVIPWNLLAFLSLFVVGTDFGTPTLVAFFAGPLIALPFVLLWVVSRGRWIGLGDGKLALGIGWFLGLVPGFSAIILSFWIGALVSVSLLGLSKVLPRIARFLPLPEDTRHLTMKSEVPFVPFLVVGFYIGLLTAVDRIIFPFQSLFG